MKKQIALMIFLTLMLSGAGHSQARPPSLDQSQSTQPADKPSTQQRYDPLAGRQHLSGGIFDNALSKINPCDTDYGARLDEWRRVVLGETLDSLVFWVALSESLGLLLALTYIYWLHRERSHRLDISTNILTQFANAYIDAKDHALDATDRHNRLADDYNAMAEKLAALEQQKTDNQRRMRAESPDAPSPEPGTDAPSVTASPLPGVAHSELDRNAPAQSQRDADARSGQRFAQQISALQEKNKALRLSLNEAVAENEQLKRARAELTGV
jgi:hypothetical protein